HRSPRSGTRLTPLGGTLPFLRELEASGQVLKTVRDGQVTAHCPAHDDPTPSLTITRVFGRVLIICRAGCPPESVVAALGMTMADLFDDKRGVQYEPYADGRVVRRRYDPKTGKKTFTQSGAKSTSVLYRAERVRAAVAAGEHFLVVEGEQDVHSWEMLGVTATTSPGGAGAWKKVDCTPLYGGNITVVADDDVAGERYANDVRASLAGRATVAITKAKVGNDSTDHILAGYGVADLVPFELPVETAAVPRARKLEVTWASSIQPEKVVWAWDTDGLGRIPAGALCLAAGRESTGKSSFGIWLSAQITTGLLPGSLYGTPRGVLYVAVEDSWKYTMVPRLIAVRADLDKVGRVDVATSGDEELMLSLPMDLPELERVIRANNVGLVVLDPLMSMIGEGIDTHRNREVREALDPLARLADRTGTVLLGIAHFNKSSGTDAASLISGSGAFKDVPRSVFGFAQDDDGRVMTQVKNSLGRDNLPSLAYEITAVEVEVLGGRTEVGTFTFAGTSTRTVEDVLRDSRTGDDDLSERTEAADWLVRWLTDQGGEGLAADAIGAAEEDGIAKRTLQRARARAKITKHKDGFRGSWIWRLPTEDVTQGAVGATVEKLASSAPSSALPAQQEPANVHTRAAWTPDSGLCTRCGAPTTRYGDGGSPLCADCAGAPITEPESPAEVTEAPPGRRGEQEGGAAPQALPLDVPEAKRVCRDCGHDRLHSDEAYERGTCITCFTKATAGVTT
ncbi:AAA family ATPase, partial [uncultured Jatrophihabitans sp.]|uniref:AAA family ATPase n=1 Tax=uncultured Jatrophihabitans sp. TaxID=1610747 RepID=UPI0035CB551E